MLKAQMFSIVSLCLCISACNSELDSSIKAPLYGSCLQYLDQLNTKATTFYDVNIEKDLFNSELEAKGGIVGLLRVSGDDRELYFNSLRYICYPEGLYSVTSTGQGIKDIAQISKRLEADRKEYYIEVTSNRISIHYNSIDEHLKSDVIR